MKINLEVLGEILLRFLSRPKKYYGTIVIKYQNGTIKNINADDSFDIKYLSEKHLEIGEKEMFIKHGSPTTKDEDSSKILSTIEIDEDKNIIKESKIKQKETENDKDN